MVPESRCSSLYMTIRRTACTYDNVRTKYSIASIILTHTPSKHTHSNNFVPHVPTQHRYTDSISIIAKIQQSNNQGWKCTLRGDDDSSNTNNNTTTYRVEIPIENLAQIVSQYMEPQSVLRRAIDRISQKHNGRLRKY